MCQRHGLWLPGGWVTSKNQNASCAHLSPADGRGGGGGGVGELCDVCLHSVPGRTPGRCPLTQAGSGGGLGASVSQGRLDVRGPGGAC